MTRRDRAREALADVIGIDSEYANPLQDIHDVTVEQAINAILAFANAELSRAQQKPQEICRIIGASPGSSIHSALAEVELAIRKMKEEK